MTQFFTRVSCLDCSWGALRRGLRRMGCYQPTVEDVMAQGVFVDKHVKVVQHRDGGIVTAIAVREGDSVKEETY